KHPTPKKARRKTQREATTTSSLCCNARVSLQRGCYYSKKALRSKKPRGKELGIGRIFREERMHHQRAGKKNCSLKHNTEQYIRKFRIMESEFASYRQNAGESELLRSEVIALSRQLIR
ncbi:hypothetical protein ACHAWX_002565, partial [Stephanocyclus meneghinianus]